MIKSTSLTVIPARSIAICAALVPIVVLVFVVTVAALAVVVVVNVVLVGRHPEKPVPGRVGEDEGQLDWLIRVLASVAEGSYCIRLW